MEATPREIDLALTADDGLRLSGTLTLPAAEGPHPAVLLLLPGKLDRDGNLGKGRVELGGALAEVLAGKGIATYRYDRRGVGATPGDWLRTGFYEHRRDAAAAFHRLAERPEIGPVAVIGYSEGALHAAALGAYEGARAVVMLAGHARTGEETLLWWAGRKDEEELSWLSRLLIRLVGCRTMRDLAARMVRKVKATEGDVARLFGVRIGARAYREFLAYDPAKDLAEVRVPLLAITGDKDVQVDPGDLELLADLVPGPVETRRFPDLTHLLRRDPGPATQRTYGEQYRRPVDPGLLEDVAAWVAAHLVKE
ncbi:alpha/beta hydrolase family protein [Nonomuraea sp. SYSU D8015]|uniref:alpha/beta hydrolase family protein n=1 Tax=Nonomuraea sp. SYSU D8015 TaxID=2593644 RepID=UPI00166144E9|nr:alpha/beta fold hydrolase [Nonomuraea sp. SYSU D8015]